METIMDGDRGTKRGASETSERRRDHVDSCAAGRLAPDDPSEVTEPTFMGRPGLARREAPDAGADRGEFLVEPSPVEPDDGQVRSIFGRQDELSVDAAQDRRSDSMYSRRIVNPRERFGSR